MIDIKNLKRLVDTLDKPYGFLHDHHKNTMSLESGLADQHVIVDKEHWELVKEVLPELVAVYEKQKAMADLSKMQ